MNRVLQMQLEEKEEAYRKSMLLNPETREQFLKAEREAKTIEQMANEYYKKTRLLG